MRVGVNISIVFHLALVECIAVGSISASQSDGHHQQPQTSRHRQTTPARVS